MSDIKTSFWTPARVAVVIGAVLLIVALAYLVSLPQNQFQPADLLEPRYAADRSGG
jgi:site-specific recombinase